MQHSHARSHAVAAAAALALLACAPGPVEWREPRVVGLGAREAEEGASPADSAWPFAPLPVWRDAHVCGDLVRYDRPGGGRTVFAAWWAARADSAASVLAARSDDGGASWNAPQPVDSLDRGARGCARPAPDIAYDPAGGYVHVVYFLDAPEGPGLFFSHSMDRGRIFHSPVAIVYGERPVSASVAADHDTVAVAYEDPNSARPRVMVALSRTAGHIFEQKSVPASGTDGAAAAPEVDVRGRTITVRWRDGAGVLERTGVLR